MALLVYNVDWHGFTTLGGPTLQLQENAPWPEHAEQLRALLRGAENCLWNGVFRYFEP